MTDLAHARLPRGWFDPNAAVLEDTMIEIVRAPVRNYHPDAITSRIDEIRHDEALARGRRQSQNWTGPLGMPLPAPVMKAPRIPRQAPQIPWWGYILAAIAFAIIWTIVSCVALGDSYAWAWEQHVTHRVHRLRVRWRLLRRLARPVIADMRETLEYQWVRWFQGLPVAVPSQEEVPEAVTECELSDLEITRACVLPIYVLIRS